MKFPGEYAKSASKSSEMKQSLAKCTFDSFGNRIQLNNSLHHLISSFRIFIIFPFFRS